MLSFTSVADTELAVIAEGITDGHQEMPELMWPMIETYREGPISFIRKRASGGDLIMRNRREKKEKHTFFCSVKDLQLGDFDPSPGQS